MRSPSRTVFHNGLVILPDRIVEDAIVVIEGDRIADIRPDNPQALEGELRVDLNGRYLGPGLIDIHIHGSNGVDLMDATEDGLSRMGQFLVSHGVTRYLPTTVPVDETAYRPVIDLVSGMISRQPAGTAQIMGLHFEGPFVNPLRSGALHPEYLRGFDAASRESLFFDRRLPDRIPIRMMTVAPEIVGGCELIEALSDAGFIVAIGHSQAAYKECEQAVAAGARHVTHFPNALSPLHHRQPGVFGWALLRSDVTVDVIADGHHVDWRMIELVRRIKAPDGMVLISDAISATGLGDGDYGVWGENISVRQGRTRNVHGTIAGSVITLWDAIRNLREQSMSLVDLVRMASLLPARIVGIGEMTGSIEKGKLADLVCFDAEGTIEFVMIEGVPAYRPT